MSSRHTSYYDLQAHLVAGEQSGGLRIFYQNGKPTRWPGKWNVLWEK
ncbi:MAG TPA: hypothetical protein VGF13_17935 [Verrucomicrobiae bacterium]|jgi:hypothetical protein